MPVKRSKRVAAAASKRAASKLVLPNCAFHDGLRSLMCRGPLVLRKPCRGEGKTPTLFLCQAHVKCIMCAKEVVDGQFAQHHRGLYCTAPPGTKDRSEQMCAFECHGCLRLLHYDNIASFNDGDTELYCHSCVDMCDLCDNEAPGKLYGHNRTFVCFDCKPLPNVRVQIVPND